MREQIWRWGPAILIMAIIFSASSTSGSDLPNFGLWDLFAKKGGHMLGYAMLAAAYFHGLSHRRTFTCSQLLIASCLAVLYAISDEFHQKFTPGRSPSVQDVFVDAAGACIGPWLWRWVRMRISKARLA